MYSSTIVDRLRSWLDKHRDWCAMGAVLFVVVVVILGGVYVLRDKPVPTLTVRLESTQLHMEFDANVTAVHKALIKPAISGPVKTFLVKVGDTVEAGQVVAELNTDDLEKQLAVMKSKVREGVSTAPAVPQSPRLAEAQSLLHSGVITLKEYQRLQAQALVSEGPVIPGPMTASYSAAQEALAKQIANSMIRSPITGRVTAIYNEDRKIAISGRPFMMIQQMAPLVASVTVPAAVAEQLKDPQVAKATKFYLEKDGYQEEGTIASMDEQALAAKQDVLVKITFINAKKVFEPGHFYHLVVDSPATASVVRIPKSAVHEQDGSHFVYIKTKEGTVDLRSVTMGNETGEMVTIVSGLSQGVEIITGKGPYTLGEKID